MMPGGGAPSGLSDASPPPSVAPLAVPTIWIKQTARPRRGVRQIWELLQNQAAAAGTPLPPPLAATTMTTSTNVSLLKEAPDRADLARDGGRVEPRERGRAFGVLYI